VGLADGKTKGIIFTSTTAPTRGKYPQFAKVVGPFRNLDHMRQYARAEGVRLTSAPRSNPPKTKGPVEIYHNITAIEATKGKSSLWPREHFRHDFRSTGARILGLPNGDLLVKKGKSGRRLWGMFNYD
jgi:hypothetical protein